MNYKSRISSWGIFFTFLLLSVFSGEKYLFYPLENFHSMEMVSAGRAGIGRSMHEESIINRLIEPPAGYNSAFPEGTVLENVEKYDNEIYIYLVFPEDTAFDEVTMELLFEQLNKTMLQFDYEVIGIRGRFERDRQWRTLDTFLPEEPVPSKFFEPETEDRRTVLRSYPPGSVSRPTPSKGLTGKSIFVSSGHGWRVSGGQWSTQRPLLHNLVEDIHTAEIAAYYLNQYLWNAGARIYPVRERDINTNMIIVENGGSGYSTTGNWITSTSAPKYWGDNYDYAHVSTTETAVATFTPDIPESGYYGVHLWYTASPNRSEDARFTIHHAGGSTEWIQNQQKDGINWVYVGTFYFEEGSNPETGSVELSNQGADTSQHVIADAVRFGGGMGIIPRNGQTSGKPRWEEASLYNAEFNKAPESVYLTAGGADRVVSASPRYSQYLLESGDDGLYISHHTDAFTGTTRGTTSFAYSSGGWGGTFNGTAGSLELRDRVHRSMVASLREFIDPNWVDRGRTTANFGEINPAHLDMPAMLTEFCFHDNPVEAEFIKDPKFREVASKAVYIGVLRYFQQRDGGEWVTLPEPPTHLRVLSHNGEVTVTWQAPEEIILSDPIGTFSYADKATGYIIYTSRDGKSWDNGTVVWGENNTSHSFTDLEQGKPHYFRVTAINDGGESFPSEVLGTRFGDERPGLLIVNGFNRLDKDLLIHEPFGSGTIYRGYIDRMNAFNYIHHYGSALHTNNFDFNSTSNESIIAGHVNLNAYHTVIWILGEESDEVDNTFNNTERSLVQNFINQGGNLFLSGSDIGFNLARPANGVAPQFFRNYLKAEYVQDSSEIWSASGISGSIFEGMSGFNFDDGSGHIYRSRYPDVYQSAQGSIQALLYSGSTHTAAVQYEGTAPGSSQEYRLVHFGFPFETILSDSTKDIIMNRILTFFGGEQPLPVADIIIEVYNAEGDLTPPPEYDEEGNWNWSAAKSNAPGLTGVDSRFSNVDPPGDDTATVTPSIETGGLYEVFVTWGTSGNAANVRYIINHRDGEDEVFLDQKPGANGNAGQWHSLGQYYFEPGQNTGKGSIIVDKSTVTGAGAPDTGWLARMYTDAFKFVCLVPEEVDPEEGYEAEIVSYNVPSLLVKNRDGEMTLTLRNTGSRTWDKTQLVYLGAVGDSDDLVGPQYYRVGLENNVAPDEVHTFTIPTYPEKAGTFITEWRMLKENEFWFGETLSRQVTVVERTNVERMIWEIFE